MKPADENICKFVTPCSEEQLKTVNFVLEQTNADNGRRKTRACDTMYLVVDGGGYLVTETRREPLTAGTLFFTFTGVPFAVESTENLVYMYIGFRGRRAATLFARLGITRERCVFPGHTGLYSFWKNALVRATGKNLDLISESVLLYTFSQMTESEERPKDSAVTRVLHVIDTEFTDSALTLESCAERLGYNAKYLSRCFKQAVGVTFSEYLRDMRIKHAVFLIEQGVCLVKNVALLSGFGDALYFSTVFRQTVGVSPGKYIRAQEVQQISSAASPAEPMNP